MCGLPEFKSLLKVGDFADPGKVEKGVNARLINLGLGNVCGRCGGSGHYSYNMINGTTCFGCKGTGYVLAKLTKALYEKAKAKVEDGTLDAYLADLKVKLEAKDACKDATGRVMAAWVAAKPEYDWMKAAQKVEPDRTIADLINKPMYDAYDRVSKLDRAVFALSVKKVATKEEREARDAALVEGYKNLAKATEEALAEIAAIKAKIPEILAAVGGA